jgi:hypothetical protein
VVVLPACAGLLFDHCGAPRTLAIGGAVAIQMVLLVTVGRSVLGDA